MAFKSEIHVAELASIRTGHTEGDIYYILDNGMLDDLPCKPGTFVKWHNDAWQIQPDEHYALASAVDGEIAQAIDNILDDGQASETIVVTVPSSQSNDYTVGRYYEVQGKVAKLRTKTDGDNVTTLTFDTTSGLLAAINDICVKYVSTSDSYSDILAIIERGQFPIMKVVVGQGYDYYYPFFENSQSALVFKCVTDDGIYGLHWNGTAWVAQDAIIYGMGSDTKSEVDIVNDSLDIDGGNAVTKVTLTTLHNVTFNVDLTVPAFAIEIDNTGNSNDVAVTVMNGSTALKYSAAAGDTVGAGKYVQLTCVGSCWTLAEFEVPTP